MSDSRVTITRHPSRKVVTIHPVGRSEDVLQTALTAARETRSSLFGWKIDMTTEPNGSHTATVTLHTD